jgi:hypothetical protein
MPIAASSSATNPPSSNRCHLQIRRRVWTHALRTYTWLSHRWRATTSLNRAFISRTISPCAIKVIGAWSKSTANSILTTEPVVGTIPSRREAETGGIAIAIRDVAAGLALTLGTTTNSVLTDSR